MKIWFSSDFHFGHDRDFIWRARGFSSVEEMNNIIIDKYNNIVSPDDHVYILGDLLLGGPDFLSVGIDFIKLLNGNLHLVKGNHDTNNRWKAYADCHNVVEMQNSIYLDYKGYYFYLSHYPSITSNFDFEKPMRQRLINLCGHSHISDPWIDWNKYNSPIVHCEVDAWDCAPVNIDLIIDEIAGKYK